MVKQVIYLCIHIHIYTSFYKLTPLYFFKQIEQKTQKHTQKNKTVGRGIKCVLLGQQQSLMCP